MGDGLPGQSADWFAMTTTAGQGEVRGGGNLSRGEILRKQIGDEFCII